MCVAPGEFFDASVSSEPEPDVAFIDIDAAIDGYVPDAFVDTTLMAHWKFDDAPADGALDSSGRGHTGTCTGTGCPLLVAGHIGNAYKFDAVDDVLIVLDSLDFRGNFTIAMWANLAAVTAQVSGMAKPGPPGNTWQLELHVSTYSHSGGSFHYLDGGPTIAANTWYHVAGTWDGTTKRLYLNGVMVASVASTTTYNTQNISLGGDDNGAGPTLLWNGMLDDLRIYNRVLNVTEIAALASQ